MDSSFELIICDILSNPLFQQTKEFMHHGPLNSVYDHSVATAYTAFCLAHRFKLSESEVRSLTRAALLHDFFGYDWHGNWFQSYLEQYSGLSKFFHMHAFIHGEIAAQRAQEHFGLTPRQYNAIASHMFPIASCLPHSKEAWLLTLSDKIVASKEVAQATRYYTKSLYRKFFPTTQQ